MSRSWFVRFPGVSTPAHRLFCFPYAGGNAHLFRTWPARLPASVEVIGIQAPGKGPRLIETPHASMRALLDDLVGAIRPLLEEGEFSFFGHSNGAMIAFELACRLYTLGLPLPQRLLLSANPAPWRRTLARPYSSMSSADFKQMLRELDGTPPELLDDDELFELVLPGLRADFALIETYQKTLKPVLPVPATVFYGTRDAIDEDHVYAWQERFAAPVDFREVDGGHFFIHTHEDQLLAQVAAMFRGRGAGASQRSVA